MRKFHGNPTESDRSIALRPHTKVLRHDHARNDVLETPEEMVVRVVHQDAMASILFAGFRDAEKEGPVGNRRRGRNFSNLKSHRATQHNRRSV